MAGTRAVWLTARLAVLVLAVGQVSGVLGDSNWKAIPWPIPAYTYDGCNRLPPVPRQALMRSKNPVFPGFVFERKLSGLVPMCLGDLDGDGYPELLMATAGGRLQALSRGMREVWVSRLDGLRDPAIHDVDGDGLNEVTALTRAQTDDADRFLGPPRIVCLDGRTGRTRSDAQVKLPDEWSKLKGREIVEFFPMFVEDLDGDGVAEVGVCALSPRLRQLLLYHVGRAEPVAVAPLPMVPGPLLPADLDGDGKLEVVLSGRAASNGLEAWGIDDSHCHVVALDCRLRHVWSSPALAGVFAIGWPAVLRKKGRRVTELVVNVRAAAGCRTRGGALFVLDAATGKVLRRRRLVDSLEDCVVGDFCGGSSPEIAVVEAGIVRVFDAKLRPVDTGIAPALLALRRAHWRTRGFAADLDADGKDELVMADGPQLVVVDLYRAPSVQRVGPRRRALRPVDPAWPVDSDGDRRWDRVLVAHASDTEIYAVGAMQLLNRLVVKDRLTLRQPFGAITKFAWSPDGRYVLTWHEEGTGELWRWRGSRSRRVARFSELQQAAFSPDGKRLALVVGRRTQLRSLRAVRVEYGDWKTPAATAANVVVIENPDPDVAYAVEGAVVSYDIAFGREHEIGRGRFGPSVCWGDNETIVVPVYNAGNFDLAVSRNGRALDRKLLAEANSPADELYAGVTSDGSYITFLRWHHWPLPGQQSIDGPALYAALTSGGPVRWLTPTTAVKEAWEWCSLLTEPAWLQEFEHPRDAFGVKYITEHAIPPVVPAGGARVAFKYVERRVHWNAERRVAHIYSLPKDICLVDVAAGTTRFITLDDDADESNPSANRYGTWIAYEAIDAASYRTEPEIWVTDRVGLRRQRVAAGWAPQWHPSEPNELWFVADGALARVRVQAVAPAAGRGLLVMGVAWAAVTLVLAGFMAQVRVSERAIIGIEVLATLLALAQSRGRAWAVARLVWRLDRIFAALHSAKNAADLVPEAEDEPIEEVVRLIVEGEGLDAIEGDVRAALRLVDDLARRRRAVEIVAREALGDRARAVTEAVNSLIAARPLLANYVRRIRALGQRVVCGAPDPAAAKECALALQGLYGLLADPDTGLLQQLRQALAAFDLRAVAAEAVDVMRPKAVARGVKLEGPSAGHPSYLCIPGPPEPIRRVLTDIIANAIESAADAKAQRGQPGAVTVMVNDIGGQRLEVVVADNGVGLSDAELKMLNRGHVLRSRGSTAYGFAHARRVIATYPGGRIQIESEGPGRGAAVRIRMGTVLSLWG